MTALLTEPPELKLLSWLAESETAVKPSSGAVLPYNVEAGCTNNTCRAETVTPVLKRTFEPRPPSHWGINE